MNTHTAADSVSRALNYLLMFPIQQYGINVTVTELFFQLILKTYHRNCRFVLFIYCSKFWTRNRPGDRMRDKYNLNTLPMGVSEEMLEYGKMRLYSLESRIKIYLAILT